MDDIVTVQRIPSGEVAEAEEDLHVLVVVQLHHVFARLLYRQWRRRSVSGNNLVLLKMNMDGVHPAS